MKFVIDKNIPFADIMFADISDNICLLDGHSITPDVVRDADVLLVRSNTPVNEKLLAGSTVRFVGTATIGDDHVDIEYLRLQGITFASAPGSNANSVAEYVVSALLTLALRYDIELEGMTLGVVGVGNIGSKVVKKAQALGMRVLQNDPPLERTMKTSQFSSLEELLGQSDIVTLHVPLTRTGIDSTDHLLGEKNIAKMKGNSILINTSRGPIVESESLKKYLRSKHLHAAVLDVWENEPAIDPELLSLVALGTPHIAGYSVDGKANGSMMMYNAVCKYLKIPNTWTLEGRLAPPLFPVLYADMNLDNKQQVLQDIITKCYSIERDDAQLRQLLSLPRDQHGRHFKELRIQYPVRREFSATTVKVSTDAAAVGKCLSDLGFRVEWTGANDGAMQGDEQPPPVKTHKQTNVH